MAEPGKFKFELVSPESLVMAQEVEQVVVPGMEGYFTVLPHHAPVLSSLKPGILEVRIKPGDERKIYVRGGFAQVNQTNLRILAQRTVNLEDLDRARLLEEISDAEADLAEAKDDEARRKAADTLERLKTLQEVVLQSA